MPQLHYVVIVLPMLSLGCGPRTPSPSAAPRKVQVGGVDTPIDTNRLTNARLLSVGDPQIEWVFKDSDFSVDSGDKTLPKDLSEPLLGAGLSGTRVEGKWRLDAVKSELVLTELRSGDQPGQAGATLPILPAGAVRANLGKRQYNIVPLSKRP
jgi:hypothetical protein